MLFNSVEFILSFPIVTTLYFILPNRWRWLLLFHTFQALAYTIEVYRGNQPAERHLGVCALYVIFYPQLVGGPIERPQNLIHQFKEDHRFVPENVVSGLRLMLWGFFKKVVIADRLAMLVNQVYNPQEYSGLPLVIATYCFTYQIYCDFSGYGDIAFGAARVMGVNLMNNFNSPYADSNIQDFWAPCRSPLTKTR